MIDCKCMVDTFSSPLLTWVHHFSNHLIIYNFIIAHLWCGGHSTSISACRVWRVRGSSLQKGTSHACTLRLG